MYICFSDQKESYNSNFRKLATTRKRKFNKPFSPIEGLLKEYLRELPEPVFSNCLYQMLVDAIFLVKSKYAVLGFSHLTNFLFSVLQDSSKSI